MNHLTIGLKLIRSDLDNTQLEMATELGISISTYKRYENGDMSIPGSVLLKLSEMNYNVNWLLTGEGEMLQPIRDNELLRDISKLTEADLNLIKITINRLKFK